MSTSALVDVVVPVYNEEAIVAPNMRRLRAHLDQKGRGRAVKRAWAQSGGGHRRLYAVTVGGVPVYDVTAAEGS